MSNLVQTGLKKKIRSKIPDSLFKHVEKPYHITRAILAQIRYGLPARGMTVIGVTGSNGKSTSVNLIASIMREAGMNVGAFTTLSLHFGDKTEKNPIGTTSSNVFEIMKFYKRMREQGIDVVVQEVTSHALEQYRVFGIKFVGAMITNLEHEHLDYHGTMENYAAAKGKLFEKNLKFAVLNADNEWYDFFSKYTGTEHTYAYGQSDTANAKIINLKNDINGIEFDLDIEGHVIHLKSKLIGIGNVQNIAGAAATAYAHGVADEAIQTGIAAIESMPGRLFRVDEGQEFAVFSDVSHTPEGLQLIFDILRELTEGRIILVQSCMDGRDPKKRIELGEVGGKNADAIFVCDDEAFELPRATMRSWILEGIKNVDSQAKVVEIEDRQEAITAAMAEAQPGDTVLVIPFGHFDSMNFYGTTKSWDEAEAIRKSLRFVLGKADKAPESIWAPGEKDKGYKGK